MVLRTISQAYFVDGRKTIVYTDASPNAVGAVLVQEDQEGQERIVSFASKTLTETEKRYAQTQREALGIVWGVEHFYYYLLGRKFLIKTDAQGIRFIFDHNRQPSKKAMSRAEGWALRLSAYDYDIEFIEGRKNIADPSSRLGDEPNLNVLSVSLENDRSGRQFDASLGEISTEVADIRFSKDHLTAQEIKFFTARDAKLNSLLTALRNGGWDDALLGEYGGRRSEFYELDGAVMIGDVVVVPEMLRPKALNLAHEGHPGMTAMKSILKSRVWWPGVKNQVENWVRTCFQCTITARKDPPHTMMSSELPKSPWDKIAIDFNGPHTRHNGVLILVMVDCYSRYLIANPVRSTDFESTRNALCEVFDIFGYPKCLKADNGSPFNSNDYKKFCADRGIATIHSTPLFPQQNGQAERYMQLINKAIETALDEAIDFREALQKAVKAHNSSECRAIGAVPEEIMFGRKLRGKLPLLVEPLTRTDHKAIRARDWLEKSKAKIREDTNRSAKDTSIKVGDIVVVLRAQRSKGQSRFGETKFRVNEKHRGDLQIMSLDGKQNLRRNVTFVKKVFERETSLIDSHRSIVCEQRPSNVIPMPDDQLFVSQSLPHSRDSSPARQEPEPRRPKRSTKRPSYLEGYDCSLVSLDE
jgi:RNase H-like domain found in reverse transcriptase/Integrase zinc binding domain/Integrase core domain